MPAPPTSTPPNAGSSPRSMWSYYRRHGTSAGLGLLALIATNLLSVCIPRLIGQAVDLVKQGAALDAVGRTALLISGVALLAAVARIASRISLFHAGRAAEHDLRVDLFDHLCTLPPSFYRSHPAGDLVSRSTSDVSNVRVLMGFGVLTVGNFVLVYALNLPLLFLIDGWLSVVALSAVPILVLVTRFGSRAIYRSSLQVQEALGDLSARITESLAGMAVVRSLGRETAELTAFDGLNQGYYGASVRLAWIRNLLWPAAGLIFGAAALAVLWLGGQRVVEGSLSLGELVEFNARLAVITWPSMAIGWVAGMWQRSRASMDRINHVLATAPSIADLPGAVAPALRGAVSARGLSVRYADGPDAALHEVSFELAAGGVLGVVGRTGSGKSTLARALPRLVELDPGQLYLDGVDVTQIQLPALRRFVGYAEQDTFLFSASLRDNLRFANPEAPDQAVQEAIDVAGLAPDLAALPAGLDTEVGERGVTLSGGQKQRAGLARALLSRPGMLVLDDCLAAVDAETEAAIVAGLTQLVRARGWSTVIVSHRLAAVREADEILVLDQGRVVARGTHQQLLSQPGLYAELWGVQAVEREVDAHGDRT